MKINYTETTTPIRVIFIDKEMEEAHNDYINRKRDMLNKLQTMIDNEELPTIYRKWLDQVYDFVEEEH